MSAVNQMLRRMRVLLDRALLTGVDYQGRVRLLQVSSRAGTAQDRVEHLEPYGYTSHPLNGAEALVGNLGGNGGRAVVILVNDRRHRIVVEEGEVAIYDHTGDFVHLRAGGEIHVRASTRVFLETPLVECSADLRVHGNARVDGTTLLVGAVTANATAVIMGNVTMQAGLGIAGNTTSTGNFSTSGDVTAGGISLRNHLTTNVQPGSGVSGGPT